MRLPEWAWLLRRFLLCTELHAHAPQVAKPKSPKALEPEPSVPALDLAWNLKGASKILEPLRLYNYGVRV